MTCPGCGHAVTEGSTRCPGCGASLPAADATVTRLPEASSADPADAPTAAGAPVTPPGTSPGPGAAASYDTLKPGARLGERYEIVSVLGAGGMGIVYRAQDLKLLREVALKVMRPELLQNPQIGERFRREILLASKITHKNILRIHDLGESDGLAYISMNYVEGETLSDQIQREGTLPVEKAVSIAVQICDAMQAAHEAGVVHRDLKPQNVLIDKEGVVYIADFGISRSLEAGDTMTQQGAVLGTVNYMSPEQARGETPDHRGDIYSMGMVIYKMLAGELPFDAEQVSSFQGMMRRIQEEIPPIRKSHPEVPKWLAEIVSRALRRDPAERYQSAAELKNDLERKEATVSWRQVLKPRLVVRSAAVLLVVALAAAAFVLVPRLLGDRRAADVAAAPRASLVLLPFRNSTGDPGYDWIGAGLPDLLRTDLMQSKTLRLVEEDRIRGVFDGLRIDGTDDLRPDTLHRVAGLLGADNLLTASLLRAGETFRIEAKLQQVTGNTVSAASSYRVEGKGEDSLFAMVDELTEQLRGDLGVGKRWGEKDRGVSELSTSSVEALKLYGEGLALARVGNHLEAARQLEAAVAADADFAVARASLAETYDQLGYNEKALAEVDRALQDLQEVSPQEAERIRAIKARLDSDLEAAERAYTEVTRISPNSAEAFFGLATVQEQQGDLEEAFKSMSRVLELDPKHAEAQYALGRLHAKLGNLADALVQFNAALASHEETGNDEGRATVLFGLGNAHRLLSEWDQALAKYGEALEIQERIGDRSGAGRTTSMMAVVLDAMGRNDEAIQTASRAVEILEEIGDSGGVARAYSLLGDLQQSAGRPEDALEAYQASMKIVRDLGDEASLAWNLSSVGYINTVLGNYVQAFFFLKEALAKRREIGDPTEVMTSLQDIGILEQIQGRYEEAIRYNMEGLTLARELAHREGQITFSMNLSNINEEQGEYAPALTRLGEAEAAAREIGDKLLVASCLADIGETRIRLGDLAGAGQAFDEALSLARETGNAPLLAKVLSGQSARLRAEGKPDEAATASREAVRAAEQAKEHRLLLIARMQAAESAGSASELGKISAEAESSGLAPLVSHARLALARVHLDAGRMQQAQDEAEAAAELAAKLNQRDLLFEAHHVAAASLGARGKSEPALAHYLAGLDALEQIRQGLAGQSLAHLLGRSQTVAFGGEARGVIRALNRADAEQRLQVLTP